MRDSDAPLDLVRVQRPSQQLPLSEHGDQGICFILPLLVLFAPSNLVPRPQDPPSIHCQGLLRACCWSCIFYLGYLESPWAWSHCTPRRQSHRLCSWLGDGQGYHVVDCKLRHPNCMAIVHSRRADADAGFRSTIPILLVSRRNPKTLYGPSSSPSRSVSQSHHSSASLSLLHLPSSTEAHLFGILLISSVDSSRAPTPANVLVFSSFQLLSHLHNSVPISLRTPSVPAQT